MGPAGPPRRRRDAPARAGLSRGADDPRSLGAAARRAAAADPRNLGAAARRPGADAAMLDFWDDVTAKAPARPKFLELCTVAIL